MTAAERRTLDDLADRVAHLEGVVAKAMRVTGTGKPKRKSDGAHTNGDTKPRGPARWLEHARFPNKCLGPCGGHVAQGERCWYEPGKGVWHEACAPAHAAKVPVTA